MNLRRTALAAFAALFLAASAFAASNGVVISQIYGGGGNASATYNRDFIELFNRGTVAVPLSGYSVQYASATGTGNFVAAPLTGSIAPGGYYLVVLAGGTTGVAPPASDAAPSALNMAAGAGKVILASTSTSLACNGGSTPCNAAQLASIVDLVGWGNANFFEGSAAPGASTNATATFRRADGCTETDNNGNDFVVASVSPRNSATTPKPCAPTNQAPTIGSFANPYATVPQGTGSVTVNLSGNDDGGIYNWNATVPAGSVVTGVTVSGQTTANATFVATLNPAFNGIASFNVTLSDNVNTATATVNISVTPAIPNGSVVISQVYGGGGNSGSVLKNDFIELFNRTGSAITLNGWSVQYRSSSGAWTATTLNGVIQPFSYFLVQEATQGGGTVDLPTPDASGLLTLGGSDGVVALSSSSTVLTGCPVAGSIMDLVAYGASAASCPEGSATPALTSTTAAFRRSGGCVDSNNNSADFVTGTAAPRNSSAGSRSCGNLDPVINAPANPIATVPQYSAPFNVTLSGVDDLGTYIWSATAGAGVDSISITSGSSATPTFTITLEPGFAGLANFTATLTDGVNVPATVTANINVTETVLSHLVISQIYGGGGNTSAPYTHDYVEIFNPTSSTVNVTGWSVQYQAATSTGDWAVQTIGGLIQPGEYFLVRLGRGDNNGPLTEPAANIEGDINLSGTNGKVALVGNSDPLNGCPSASAFIDLVGYGATANCREGVANAPAPSNTTSIFRRTSGASYLDTNNNGTDFVTGAPNPRRTTPIQELAPWIASFEPRNNGTNAPRDANIEVNFSEPVSVTGQWFDISCSISGGHNDATVSRRFNNELYVIIPNRNFTAGETCTVAVFKQFIHDEDVDDSAPDTDELLFSRTISFTVATGAAPVYPASVHLTMGNPSGAVADTNQADNYLMMKPEFALSYNRGRGIPNWVSWHLSDEWVGTLTRVDTFRADAAVPPTWFRVLGSDYSGSGFDRGHLAPNADRDKETSIPINQATFLMTNMMPQAPDNNQGPWANLEAYLRTLLPANELYIVAGGTGTGGTGSKGYATTIADGNVTVPAKTWKVVLVLPKRTAANDVTAGARTIAVILPNVQGIRNVDWREYLTTVDMVEGLTGYDFFAELPDAVENAVEAGIDGANPPGVVAQQNVTNEDTPASVYLTAASSTTSFSFNIVATPTHGTLSGAGANRTYTPAPDFNGTDSFTFTATNTIGTSNTATFTITVNAVNDAPVATDDSVTVAEDGELSFAAATLTTNDSAGPADEPSTLTVSSVTALANTHGSVSLASGVITFIPASNYFGPAAFSYAVCDSGSLCTTATVNVTVTPVNDAPVASFSAVPATSAEGTAIATSVSGSDVDDVTLTYAWTVKKNGNAYASGSTPAISFTPTDNGTYTIEATVTDAAQANGSASAVVAVTNVAPQVSLQSQTTSPITEGSAASFSASATDAGTADTVVLEWAVTKNGGNYATGSGSNFSFTPDDDGTYVVTVTAIDDDGGSAPASQTIAATNAVPVIASTSQSATLLSVGSAASVTITYTDAGSADTHTMIVNWDDNSTSSTVSCTAGVCTASRTFTATGVYSVTATLLDDDGGSTAGTFERIVVVDTTAGSVTGGGFVGSGQNKSNFGFNGKYNKGVVTGQVQFNATSVNFHSSSTEWLVVAGSRAQLRGKGTVNGVGGYEFLLTAVDGETQSGDRFRIKIWSPSTSTVVFDNVAGAPDDIDSANPQLLGGGNISVSSR